MNLPQSIDAMFCVLVLPNHVLFFLCMSYFFKCYYLVLLSCFVLTELNKWIDEISILYSYNLCVLQSKII